MEKEQEIEINNINQNIVGKRVVFVNNLIRIKQEDYMIKRTNSNIFVLVQMTINKNENINNDKASRVLNSIQ